MQYYGIDRNGNTVFVGMSKQDVMNYAEKHPEENIIRVEDRFGNGYNFKESLVEKLKKWDKKEFKDNSNTYELEMLYESVKNTLSAQQKNDLAKFVRKAKTADEINTFMTGMLAKEANESLQESGHFEYGNIINKANQAVDIIDFASDKNGNDIYLGSTVMVPQQLGYVDREAQVEDIFINKHGVEMLRVKYNDSKTKNVAAKSCTLIEGLNEDINEESFNKLKELAYELDNYIEDKVWVRDFWYDGQFENTITFSISGDWKHDHARFDYYASEWLDDKGIDYKISEYITDDSEDDSYEANHIIKIYNILDEAFDKPPHEFWYYTKHGLGPGTVPKDVEILDIYEDDNWGTYIKLDKVLTTNELNYYDLKEKVPKELVEAKQTSKKDMIITQFIEQCNEKFDTFGNKTDAELELPIKFDTDNFWYDLENACRNDGFSFDLREREIIPDTNMLYLYFYIKKED